MRVILVDPMVDGRWDKFVSECPGSTIYHHSSWSRVLQESYGYQPYCYAVEEGGELIAVAPFLRVSSWLTGERLTCLPFSDHCFPLSRTAEGAELLLKAVQEEATRQSISLEVRGRGNGLDPVEAGFSEKDSYVIHLAEMEGKSDQLMERLHYRARRGIKEAEKRGVTVREAMGEEDLKEFYRLNVLTRKKHGVLPQPFRFFQAIQRHILAPGRGILLLAENSGKTIAGVLYLLFRDTVTYKFNASDEAYLKLRPNHLLIWTAMEWACQKGYKVFDFGRCDLENAGLREFKRQWAAQEFPLPYYYYPQIRRVWALRGKGLATRAIETGVRFMPSFILRLAGSALYWHLG